jgi:hypothetical protein
MGNPQSGAPPAVIHTTRIHPYSEAGDRRPGSAPTSINPIGKRRTPHQRRDPVMYHLIVHTAAGRNYQAAAGTGDETLDIVRDHLARHLADGPSAGPLPAPGARNTSAGSTSTATPTTSRTTSPAPSTGTTASGTAWPGSSTSNTIVGAVRFNDRQHADQPGGRDHVTNRPPPPWRIPTATAAMIAPVRTPARAAGLGGHRRPARHPAGQQVLTIPPRRLRADANSGWSIQFRGGMGGLGSRPTASATSAP